MTYETMATLRPCSPPAAPLEDDDLLSEILLRLPPQPSSLPRASAVSKRWRGLASDPRFCSRFRAHHRRNPPLLGCFLDDLLHIRFEPALEAPNRIPQGRFSFPMESGNRPMPLGCRHGLVLGLHKKHLLVWDPAIGDQQLLDIPPGFDMKENWVGAAVFRAAGDVRDFQVVLVGNSDMPPMQMVASVYSSKTGTWGDLTTAPLPPADSSGIVPLDVCPEIPGVMVGDSFYWLLGFNAQLWKRKTNCDGVSSWVLQRTIALDEVLSINLEKETESPSIIGFAEGNNVVLVSTSIGVFTFQLESLQFKKLFESKDYDGYYPFEGVYTADKGTGGGRDGAELLQNA
ncbi:unnamed protein product [Alopecurus aequalis]